jgi:hypothetical protein
MDGKGGKGLLAGKTTAAAAACEEKEKKKQLVFRFFAKSTPFFFSNGIDLAEL